MSLPRCLAILRREAVKDTLIRRPTLVSQRQFGSSLEQKTPPIDREYIRNNYIVRRRGEEGYGSREYLLVPRDTTKDQVQQDPSLIVASLWAHRNILFGARTTVNGFTLQDIGQPLVEQAVHDAGENGEQPQAIASLAGLCDWVKTSLQTPGDCKALEELKSTSPIGFAAVQAMATGIPRSGHSVVGVGTYRDGEEGWKAIATEYVTRGLSDEASLYLQHGGRLVTIEHLADQNPHYLASAGGAMARLFFL